MTEDKISYITIETYTCFRNVDRSILKLNPILEPLGYSFHTYSIPQLESQFSELFHLPKNFTSKTKVRLEGSEEIVSHEFLKLLMNQWGNSIIMDGEIIMLKRITDFELEIINRRVSVSTINDVFTEVKSFSENLVKQLRLYKSGSIESDTTFQISKIERNVSSRQDNGQKARRSLAKFTLSDEEIFIQPPVIKRELTISGHHDLALTNFFLSYSINDMRPRFVTLISCLESLFNVGRDQITHIVARNTSLIISNDETAFNVNYKRVKKLYAIRSAIVHGSKDSNQSNQPVIELEELCRKVLNYCLQLNISKKELFDHLNSKGYAKETVALSPHKVWSSFYNNIGFDQFKEKLTSSIKFKQGVNPDVIKAFKIIGQLLTHSYFEYEFLDVAYAKALQTFEMALKLRYKEINGTDWNKKFRLVELIKWFEDRTYFEITDPNFMNQVRHARNYFSHPNRYGFGGYAGLHWISTTVDLINDLYEDVELRKQRFEYRDLINGALSKMSTGAKLQAENLTMIIYNIILLVPNNKVKPSTYAFIITPLFKSMNSQVVPFIIEFDENSLTVTDSGLSIYNEKIQAASVLPLNESELLELANWRKQFTDEELTMKSMSLRIAEQEMINSSRRKLQFYNESI
jgi:hypothetical protein